MVDLAVISPSDASLFTETDFRKVVIVHELTRSGLPLDTLAGALREHKLSLDYLDQPGFERIASLSGQTFQELAQSTGVPVGLLQALREATGFAQPAPTDAVKTDELAVVRHIQAMLDAGVPEQEAERALRTYGDSARRIAETESFWFDHYVLGPFFQSGKPWSEISDMVGKPAQAIAASSDAAFLSIIHAQQSHTWIRSIFDQFESYMAQQGLVEGSGPQPAICFLDLTGYTRLTEQHGDAAAADVAGNLARLVQRSATSNGGRAVKWLGDGVMFYFKAPDRAVLAALEMVENSSAAGLPPAHVGVHSGPVLFQEGDYFGRTVNAASRIADYARPGEVLVTREVADATSAPSVRFAPIGPVALKGMAEELFLLAASRQS